MLATVARHLRRAFSVVFRQHLKLRVVGNGVRVVLQQRSDPRLHREPSAEERQARHAAQELALMRQQLHDLLNDSPETRLALRQLACVEQTLEHQGQAALQQLPADLLQRALEQLEGLVVNWSPVGLALLRSRLVVAALAQERQTAADADADAVAAGHAPRPGRAGKADADTVIDSRPDAGFSSGVDVSAAEDEALAAAYAALGPWAPVVPVAPITPVTAVTAVLPKAAIAGATGAIVDA